MVAVSDMAAVSDMVAVSDMAGRVPVSDRVVVPYMVLVPDKVLVLDTLGIPDIQEPAVPPFPVKPEVLPGRERQGLVLDTSLLQQMENSEIQSRCQHLPQKLLRLHYRLHDRLWDVHGT